MNTMMKHIMTIGGTFNMQKERFRVLLPTQRAVIGLWPSLLASSSLLVGITAFVSTGLDWIPLFSAGGFGLGVGGVLMQTQSAKRAELLMPKILTRDKLTPSFHDCHPDVASLAALLQQQRTLRPITVNCVKGKYQLRR